MQGVCPRPRPTNTSATCPSTNIYQWARGAHPPENHCKVTKNRVELTEDLEKLGALTHRDENWATMRDIDCWRMDPGRPACFGAETPRAGADTKQLRQTEHGKTHS